MEVYARFFSNEFGLMGTAYQARSQMTEQDVELLNEILGWFSDFLEVPNFDNKDAVCWFKRTAEKHIEKCFSLCEILERYNIKINVVVSENVGKIIYEDEYQVVAVPE